MQTASKQLDSSGESIYQDEFPASANLVLAYCGARAHVTGASLDVTGRSEHVTCVCDKNGPCPSVFGVKTLEYLNHLVTIQMLGKNIQKKE